MQLNKKLQKKLLRLISARNDLAESSGAAKLLMNGLELPPTSIGHIFLSMVVSYGRPFTENTGVGAISCDYPDYPQRFGEDVILKHNRLIQLRNEFFAHGQLGANGVKLVPPNVFDPSSGKSFDHWTYLIGRREFLHPKFVDWLREAPDKFGMLIRADVAALLEGISPHSPPTAIIEIPTGVDDFRWNDGPRTPGRVSCFHRIKKRLRKPFKKWLMH